MTMMMTRKITMIDPEKEIRRRVFNRGRAVPLTYEQYCLL